MIKKNFDFVIIQRESNMYHRGPGVCKLIPIEPPIFGLVPDRGIKYQFASDFSTSVNSQCSSAFQMLIFYEVVNSMLVF